MVHFETQELAPSPTLVLVPSVSGDHTQVNFFRPYSSYQKCGERVHLGIILRGMKLKAT